VKSAYWSFRIGRFGSEAVAAEQAFHRMVWWLYALLGEERAREFMLNVVDPDPIEPNLALREAARKYQEAIACGDLVVTD
jgi:hypothetical protein